MDHINILICILLVFVHLGLSLCGFSLPVFSYLMIERQRYFAHHILLFLRFWVLILRLSLLVEGHLVRGLSLVPESSIMSTHVYVIWIHMHLGRHIIVVDYVIGVIIIHIYDVHLSVPRRQPIGDMRILLFLILSFFLLLLYFI